MLLIIRHVCTEWWNELLVFYLSLSLTDKPLAANSKNVFHKSPRVYATLYKSNQ